ncbi:MAG: hypothetical protein HOH33_08065 [Verrucomicrobia bacterium]|nr:hypothetical protein [Verrucomicrobiota bacterium]
MNFVFKCKWLGVCAVIAPAAVLTGCGGVNAGGGASPATFFLPGMAGVESRADEGPLFAPVLANEPGSKSISDTLPVFFQEVPFNRTADSDPS